MTVYVDNVRVAWRGQRWCHLVADSLDELHEFAKRLGLQRNWYQRGASYPHYDITTRARLQAIAFGALPGNRAQIITCARKLKVEQYERERCAPEQFSLFQDFST